MIEKAFTSGGSFDFTVAKKDAADIVLSYLKEEQIEKVKNTEGVADYVEMLYYVTQYEKNPFFIAIGVTPEKGSMFYTNLIEGQELDPSDTNKVLIGKVASQNFKKNINDKIKLGEKEYSIVGIYESGVPFYDGGAVIHLTEAQTAQELENTVNMIGVKIKEGHNVEEVADRIESEQAEVTAIVDSSDYDAVDQGMKVTRAMTWVISILAIIIGGIGVMNTMIMSVFERTREIGILRSLGWTRFRILSLIIIESLVIGLFSIIIGGLLGLLIVKGIAALPAVKGFIEPTFTYMTLVKAIIVSVGVALVGGIYPAIRAAYFSPLEALRYE